MKQTKHPEKIASARRPSFLPGGIASKIIASTCLMFIAVIIVVMYISYGMYRDAFYNYGNALCLSSNAQVAYAINGDLVERYARTGRVTAVDALTWKDALVVGLPLALDGGEQRASRGARRFAERLRQRSNLPVHLADERHSSQEAAGRFAAARHAGAARRRDAANIDSLAAAVILEGWLREPA